MALRTPAIRALRLFIEVMSKGTLTEAAERLNITQSAASRMLAGLEQDLDFELFRRERQRLVPTSEAIRFLSEAERAVAVLDDLPRISLNIKEGSQGHIHVLTQDRFAQELLPDALSQDWQGPGPLTTVSVSIESRRRLEHWLKTPHFDFALTTLPLSFSEIVTEKIGELPLVAVLSKDHPLAKRPILTVQDLEHVPLALITRGSLLREKIEQMFLDAEVTPFIHFEVHSAISSCRIALRTGCVAMTDGVLPAYLLNSEAVVRRLYPKQSISIGFAEPANRQRRRVDSLKDAIRQSVHRRIEEIDRLLEKVEKGR